MIDRMEGYTEAIEQELARLRAELKRAQDQIVALRGELARERCVRQAELAQRQTAKAA